MATVLHVVASNARRGAEVFATELAGALRSGGWTSEVVAVEHLSDNGLAVAVAAGRWPSARTVSDLRRRISTADVVVAHGSTALPAVTIGALGTGTPFVYRNIGDPTFWASGRLARLRVGAMLRRTAAVAALWDGAGDELVRRYRLAPRRVRTIPNGVDPGRFGPLEPAVRAEVRAEWGLHPPVVAFVGSLSAEKNPRLAVDAVAAMPEGSLVVLGEGPLRAELEAASAAAAPGRIRFLGSVGDVARQIGAADVVISTSRTEGLPAALIEAGLSGVPVVATDVGGVAHIVRHGKTGYLAPANARAAEVATHVIAAVADRDRLGAAARQWCNEHFSLARVAAAWSDLLREVLEERPGG